MSATGKTPIYIGVDAGGSNTRLIGCSKPPGEPFGPVLVNEQPMKMCAPTGNFQTLREAILAFTALYHEPLQAYQIAAMGIGYAGFVNGGRADKGPAMPFGLDAPTLGEAFACDAFGTGDIASQAWGLNLMKPEDFSLLSAAGTEADPMAEQALISFGTGIGALPIVKQNNGLIVPVRATEFGATPWAATSRDEYAYRDFLLSRLGRDHLTMGRACNLWNCAQYELWKQDEAPKVVTKWLDEADDKGAEVFRIATEEVAESNGAACRRALNRYCQYVGRAAGTFAVCQGAFGGLYVAGGIPQRIGAERLVQRGFMQAVLSASPYYAELLRRMPVRLALSEAGDLGAAYMAYAHVTGLAS